MRNATSKSKGYTCRIALELTTSIFLLASSSIEFGCATAPAQKSIVPQLTLPSFIPESATGRDEGLDHAAAALCVEDVSILSDEMKEKFSLREGHYFVLVERQENRAMAFALLEEKGARLLKKQGATHTGFYISDKKSRKKSACAALVGVQRRLTLRGELRTHAQVGQKERVRLFEYVPLAKAQKGQKGQTIRVQEERNKALKKTRPKLTFFVAKPNGSVDKKQLLMNENHVAELAFSYDAGVGLYTFEVLFDKDNTPAVALLWNVYVGDKKRGPPAPKVLFNDDGHSNTALTRRTEALIQRLRTQQDIDVLRIAPALADIAEDRASFLTEEGRLGHRLPDGKTALDELKQSRRKFYVSHLAEVQAQGSTLEDAWNALLKSPAHRYEMVHQNISHMGVGVVRGKDSAGRTLLTLVAIFAKKTRKESPHILANQLLQKLNHRRQAQQSLPLRPYAKLAKMAQAQATAMAQSGLLDETLLDAGLKNRPISEVALDQFSQLKDVKSVLARIDDPLRIGANAALLDAAATHLGIGIVRRVEDGQWYVCLLIGTEGEPDPQ